MTALALPPLVQCYWVVPGRFLAGEYPAHMELPHAAARLQALLAAGLDTFYDLTERHELTPYLPLLQELGRKQGLEVNYQRFEIADRDVPKAAVMRSLLDAIDAALAHGRHLYLHCWGGIGRTGMVVGCYLVRHGLSGQAALDQIASWWQTDLRRFDFPRSPETPEQIEYILDWAAKDRAVGA